MPTPYVLLTAALLLATAAQAQTTPAAKPAPAAAKSAAPAPAAAAETPTQLVQRQVEAYNARDVARFAATYAPNVEVLDFPAKPQFTGRDKLIESFTKFFAWAPQVHCEVVSRTVFGNKVIDHERVTGLPNGRILESVAIYEVENGLIRRVTFVE